MNKRTFAITSGIVTVVAIGLIAFNYDNTVPSQRIGLPQLTTAAPTGEKDDIAPDRNAQPSHYDSAGERQEAKILNELAMLNQEIEAEQQRLAKETARAQAQETSPEQVLAQASIILSELEDQGISLTGTPIVEDTNTVSPQVQAIEQQLAGIEADLTQIENTFKNLGNNKELL